MDRDGRTTSSGRNDVNASVRAKSLPERADSLRDSAEFGGLTLASVLYGADGLIAAKAGHGPSGAGDGRPTKAGEAGAGLVGPNKLDEEGIENVGEEEDTATVIGNPCAPMELDRGACPNDSVIADGITGGKEARVKSQEVRASSCPNGSENDDVSYVLGRTQAETVPERRADGGNCALVEPHSSCSGSANDSGGTVAGAAARIGFEQMPSLAGVRDEAKRKQGSGAVNTMGRNAAAAVAAVFAASAALASSNADKKALPFSSNGACEYSH